MADNDAFQPVIIGDSSEFLSPTRKGEKRESLDVDLAPKQRLSRVTYPDLDNLVKDTMDRFSNLEISNQTYRKHSTGNRSQSVSSEDVPPLPKRPPPQSSKSFSFSESSSLTPSRCVVTDLDQAMQQRDEQKLQALFGDNLPNKSPKENTSEKKSKKTVPDDELETDLDDIGDDFKLSNILTKSPAEEVKASPEPKPKLKADIRKKDYFMPTENLEDAVKWPENCPRILRFGQKEVFEGQMLLRWFSSAISKDHYLHLILTKHDIRVIFSQFTTYLLAAGVICEHDPGPLHTVFKVNVTQHKKECQRTQKYI
ncbi:hypothetical protein LOTGIDRAFT_159889 [Lottia gigantea]|uniref:Uncharacterized protein n=1 Tax=Lottia gigantea TaxID=225164 RepID=V4ANW4_LOTGI|nr:hypothetical protein LOTGIDRAFT_159889 [Lottia gigantea]ESO96475.1 hypothetical protein LOTGIDRAFT_159889 [Lottia gigantea]